MDGEDMLIITDDKINSQRMLYLCDVKIVFSRSISQSWWVPKNPLVPLLRLVLLCENNPEKASGSGNVEVFKKELGSSRWTHMSVPNLPTPLDIPKFTKNALFWVEQKLFCL